MKLRRLADKDIPYMLEWMHDPQVNGNFQFDFQHATEASVQAFISSANADSDNLHLACANDDDVYMGTVSLKHIDRINGHAEYAVAFRTCAHGTGLAREATDALLRKAFGELALRRVYLNVLAHNKRAIAFYERAGFRYEGALREHVLIRGEYEDLVLYGLLREEYYDRH